ncbi:MAG: thioredoxin domain-containing protein [Lentisphaerae bacterium RIFOXYB12_FULL_65_16]|nr:MAG: thioredoxin domain-containing protein [Lentisphaerae bacterium RIFOXYA12_64_32]OGV88579.1 MAG: thioredoxin domain-containing protein [Lentisphaerae bacterium RIFOXYB12_FULL_65_16]
MSTTEDDTNHLGTEKSPYLLQHAHNPVDWYTWGEAAFAKARREQKPIFLSVGYSTCHWCHVMAHESFENAEIAKILNAHFVSIKVDREERPDVDKVYMTYVQATTGGGGWPMSVWLTPDLKPFFGGTYFPPENRWGQPGFGSVLTQIAAAWEKDREKILNSAAAVTRQLQQATAVRADAGVELATSLLDAGYHQFKASYEPRYGGFGGAPKFPRPVALGFMLRYHARTGTKDALDMCLFTLRKMADGGMHDHIGGGFHRYSVDTFWHVPHFEKMLYDQAQLAESYLDAYQITHDPVFADVARDILDYVLRDMTGTDGQFYSAEDADSPVPSNPAEHAEGAFYVWERQELVAALGKDTVEVFGYHYGVEPNGNAPTDPHGEFANKNILIVRHTLAATGQKFGKSADDIRDLLANACLKLREIRAQRPRPHLDDKTLTAWNGLMISALARAAQVLDEPRYLAAARKAAAFIESRLVDRKTGKLLRRYRAGEAAIDGFVDDYAFLIQGLLDLYEASFDVKWLTWATGLQEEQNGRFWDKDEGGYFSTSAESPHVLLRVKEDYDGAEPSPNSVAALNLLRLSQMTGCEEFRAQAERVFSAFGSRLEQAPHAMPQMLVACGFFLDKPLQIVIAGQPDAPDTHALLRQVHDRFVPNRVLLLADGATGQQALAQGFEFIRDVKPLDGKAAAYVCENHTCQRPTADPAELGRQLDRTRK